MFNTFLMAVAMEHDCVARDETFNYTYDDLSLCVAINKMTEAQWLDVFNELRIAHSVEETIDASLVKRTIAAHCQCGHPSDHCTAVEEIEDMEQDGWVTITDKLNALLTPPVIEELAIP